MDSHPVPGRIRRDDQELLLLRPPRLLAAQRDRQLDGLDGELPEQPLRVLLDHHLGVFPHRLKRGSLALVKRLGDQNPEVVIPVFLRVLPAANLQRGDEPEEQRLSRRVGGGGGDDGIVYGLRAAGPGAFGFGVRLVPHGVLVRDEVGSGEVLDNPAEEQPPSVVAVAPRLRPVGNRLEQLRGAVGMRQPDLKVFHPAEIDVRRHQRS
mmetsp:Transcript_33149/g.80539  ORF Transcript_33149/g.80539 Transcript_33149/m.80539 type:complete len:208 (+) Transcript_33149:2881-3504(+)